MFKVKDIMVTDVITTKKQTPVYQAIAAMVENNITGLPIINDDGTIAGIFSEKEVLTLLYSVEDVDAKIEDYMTKNPITFGPEDDIVEIIDCFVKSDFHRVPIVDKGRLIGIVSRKDIIQYILKIRKNDKLKSSLQAIHKEQNR